MAHCYYNSKRGCNRVMKTVALVVLISTVMVEESRGDSQEDKKRPIWNIGHMVNAVKQIEEFLDLGANALEADVTFDDNGNPKWTYHGTPCDCFRDCLRWEYVDEYLKRIRELTSPGSSKFRKGFILLMLDLKISKLSDNAKSKAGKEIADMIIKRLWSGSGEKAQLYIVLSFPYVNDIEFVRAFRERVKSKGFASEAEKRIGWDISGNEDLGKIRDAYQKLGITDNVWQSDGITNCLTRSHDRLAEAVCKRDSDKEWPSLKKVYYWTVDKQSSMKEALKVGVDGMITNDPDDLVAVLNEFSGTHRLANINDSPWQKIPRPKSNC
uniref:Dermonecrotic toxin Hl-PLD1 n=1 Tax=Hemiscorpius lepturus TaxID=520031 RepID=DTPLD_HEMLE|nr:RecName: Full=Dermonecrotic toxin Hl-PLD1; AltName: Full=Phospholipase D; Short=PLD; AltName: Full=Sphingomyelin phosphodiesterase D; Short=SMD; Short=SMase D; Short=Sphingomyelinase D; Flags: Precursor [Hemiscorpius lepturus]API81378.1 venom toxin [Hemiscorpius lepturus]